MRKKVITNYIADDTRYDRNYKKFSKLPWLTILPYVLVFFLCVLNGWFKHLDASFAPINGTYQNYNVWKRVLSGQSIFADFMAFYGAGQTLLGALLTGILGGTYANCQEAAEFLTMLFFSMFIFVTVYCVNGNRKHAIYVAMIINIINILHPAKLISVLQKDIAGVLEMARYNCNAQMIRAGVVPVMCLTSLAFLYYGRRRKLDLEGIRFHVLYARIVGAIMGALLLWENCMGVANYFCFSFVWLLVMLKYYHADVKKLFITLCNYIFSGVICFFAALAVMSKGNIKAFFSLNMSAASSLAWYYNNGPKILRLVDFSVDFWILTGIILGIIFLVKMLRAKDFVSTVRYMLLVSVLLGGIAANYFYAWSSGGTRKSNIILVVLGTSIAFIIRPFLHIKFLKNNSKRLELGILTFACLFGLTEAYNTQKDHQKRSQEEVYFETLGGYVSPAVAEDLRIGKQIIGDNTLFSTYSTAVDVLVGEVNPSGFDYIIHTMGEENQQKYIDAFQTAKCDFVQTVHSEYSQFQIWERNQNWYFYREMYKNYVPYAANSYSLYWKRGKEQLFDIKTKMDLEIVQTSAHECKIVVEAEETDPFVMDVRIKYNTEYPVGLRASEQLRNMVKVTDNTNPDKGNLDKKGSVLNYMYLPAEGEKEIPISVVNGYGEIILDSCGGEGTALIVEKALRGKAYATPYQYVHCLNINDSNWEKGIFKNSTRALLLENSESNKICLKDAIALKNYKGEIARIQRIENKGDYLHIILEDKKIAKNFSYPYMIEVIRKS